MQSTAAWSDLGPARLTTFENGRFLLDPDKDVITARNNSRHHISDVAARRALSWTQADRLLYTHEPPTSHFIFEKHLGDRYPWYVGSTYTATIDAPNKYPSVWIADPVTSATHQLIPRAYDASASPDGKWIAYFGWPVSEIPTPEHPAGSPGLWLFDTGSAKTFPVNGQNDGQVLWSPDSQRLVLLQFHNRLHVSVVPLADALLGPDHVAALPTAVKAAVPQPGSVDVQGVSRNGKYLVVDMVREATGPTDATEHTMEAVDLQDGHVTVIAHAHPPDLNQNFTWTWFDESDAPAAVPMLPSAP